MKNIMMQTTADVILTEILTEGNYEVTGNGIWVQLATSQFFLARTELLYTCKENKLNRQVEERVLDVVAEIDNYEQEGGLA